MNTFIVTGRLTADPQIRYTPAGAAIATFRIAVDRPFTSGENRKMDGEDRGGLGSTGV